MRPVILCDVDGILVDFAESYLRLLREMFGVHKTEADITSFHFEQCVSTPEQDRAIWQDIARNPGFVYNLPVYDGAMGFLAELRQLGRVVACTSPANPLWTAERAQWLLDKGGFEKRDIVVASDKSLVMGDVLIDDAIHNLEGWRMGPGGIRGYGLLMNRPWNSQCSGAIWARAFDYGQLLNYVRDLV